MPDSDNPKQRRSKILLSFQNLDFTLRAVSLSDLFSIVCVTTYVALCVAKLGIGELCDHFSYPSVTNNGGEFFFDRSPRNFDAVLGLYRTGKLHLSQGVSEKSESKVATFFYKTVL